jgi:hypothetical protein
MKIAIFEIEPWERQVFEGLEGEPKLVHEGGHMNAVMAERYADADIISTFIHSKLDGDRRPSCSGSTTSTIGTGRWPSRPRL